MASLPQTSQSAEVNQPDILSRGDFIVETQMKKTSQVTLGYTKYLENRATPPLAHDSLFPTPPPIHTVCLFSWTTATMQGIHYLPATKASGRMLTMYIEAATTAAQYAQSRHPDLFRLKKKNKLCSQKLTFGSIWILLLHSKRALRRHGEWTVWICLYKTTLNMLLYNLAVSAGITSTKSQTPNVGCGFPRDRNKHDSHPY